MGPDIIYCICLLKYWSYMNWRHASTRIQAPAGTCKTHEYYNVSGEC